MFIFEVNFVLKIKDNLCLFALSWKLNTKQGTNREKIHPLLLQKFIRKKSLKVK